MKRILLLTSSFLFVVSISASALTIDPPAQDTTKKKEAHPKKKDKQNAEKTTHSGTSTESGTGSGNGNQAGMTISEKGLPNDRPKGSKATTTVSPIDSAKMQTSEPKAATPHQE